jgi:NAD(P)-dependent dehydrogenase (short-subunit alcohol dehydrogenase family)
MNKMRFDGRSVVVTGGGRGFGRQHALLLASRGAKIVVADYGMELDGSGSSAEPAQLVAKEIEAAGGEAIPCFANVAEESGAAEVVKTAVDAFGGLDILINNAGICDHAWFEDLTAENFLRLVRHHYLGTVHTSLAAWPHLREADHGCIVNTASEAILGNVPKAVSYSGAKGAVFAFTRALALDGKRHGIRVNAVAPRGNTRMSDSRILAFTFDQPEENFKNEFFDQMRPEYVSPAVAFLAHESCALTGEVFVSGMLKVMRIAVIETEGLTFTPETLSPEGIAENLDALMDITDATLMGIEMFND